MKSRLQEKYRSETVPALMKRFGWKNVMAVPKLQKVTLNIGLGEASQNAKLLDTAAVELGQITGQKAIITRAKKSIANFKIRKGMPIGCAVTLRGEKMYEFLDRLCNVVLPRVRDFRGLPSHAFDGRGNYTLGLKDQLVFPEIDYTRVDKIKGMNITITTSARNDEEGRELLKLLGVPVVPAAGVVTIGLIGYCLYEWLSNDAYAVNNHGSLIYMGAMYVLALVIYLAARVIRSRQGIDLSLINKEIPVE